MSKIGNVISAVNFTAPAVLVVSELDFLGTHLVDSLLERGCRVYYLGERQKENFSYLENKRDFQILRSFSKIKDLPALGYIFYLSSKNKKFLPGLAKISKDQANKLLLVFSGSIETGRKVIKNLSDDGLDARVVIFDEIYGPRVKEGLVSEMIFSAFLGKRIKLPAEVRLARKLIYVADFIKGLTWAIFSPESSGKIFDFSGEEVSFLTILNELGRKLKQSSQVDFIKEKLKGEEIRIKTAYSGKSSFPSETKFEEGIEQTILWLERERENPTITKNKLGNLTSFNFIKSKRIKRIIFGATMFFLLTSVLFLVPIGFFLVGVVSLRKDLRETEKFLRVGDFRLAKYETNKGIEKKEFLEKVFLVASPFYDLFGFEELMSQTDRLLLIGGKKMNFLKTSLETFDLVIPIASDFLNSQPTNLAYKTNEASSFLENLHLNASYLAALEQDSFLIGDLVKSLGIEKFWSIGFDFTEIQKEIYRAKLLLSLTPQIFGKEGSEKRYLVVFQNQFELRPGGGKIDSLGRLVIKNGTLSEFAVFKLDLAIDKPKTKVEPPGKVKELLGESDWTIKDANWEVAFPQSAEQIKLFYENSYKENLDGVMTVNLNLIKAILDLTGGVTDELVGEVSGKNIFETVQNYSVNSSPDEIGLIARIADKIFKQFDKNNDIEVLKAGRILSSALKTKDLMIWFTSEDLKKYLRLFNWDGSIQSNTACRSIQGECLEDYLLINEANLGVNRANYYLKRMINHSLSFTEEGELKEILKIYYQNLSLSDKWPAGFYKNYIRIYLPLETRVASIMINDPSKPGLWLQIPSEKIDVVLENEKLVLGFLVEVPERSSRVVEVKYQPPFKINFQKSFSYTLLTQRQSGFGETPRSLLISYPKRTTPLKILPSGVLVNNRVLVNDSLERDGMIRVDFGN